MTDSLTPRQREIADFIRTYQRRYGSPPSYREIGEHFGIRSPNGVVCHLDALISKGVITKRSGPMHRSLRFVEQDRQPEVSITGDQVTIRNVPETLSVAEARALAMKIFDMTRKPVVEQQKVDQFLKGELA